MVIDLAIVAGTLKWGDIEKIAVASLKGIVVGDCLIAVVALLVSTHDESGRLGDVDFLHPGNVGNFAAIGALCSLYFWFRTRAEAGRNKLYWGTCAVFLCWVLIRSLSKTSIIAFSAAFITYLVICRGISVSAKVRVGVVAVVLFASMYGTVYAYVESYLEESPTDVTTLTGRTVLWARTWEMIQDRPIIGYGFLSFRDYGPQDWEQRTSHGHNEWLTQWFQLGGIGLALTIGIYAAYFRDLRTASPSRGRELGFALLVYTLIEGSAIAEAYGLMFPLTMVLLLSIWTQVPQAFDQRVEVLPPAFGAHAIGAKIHGRL